MESWVQKEKLALGNVHAIIIARNKNGFMFNFGYWTKRILKIILKSVIFEKSEHVLLYLDEQVLFLYLFVYEEIYKWSHKDELNFVIEFVFYVHSYIDTCVVSTLNNFIVKCI